MKLSLSRLGVNRRKLLLIIKVGLPAGIQGAIFCDLQRTDSVVRQFLRFDCDGRQHGVAEYRGICVYLDECAVSDQFKLYEPEYRSGEIYADQKILATCQGVVVTVGLVLDLQHTSEVRGCCRYIQKMPTLFPMDCSGCRSSVRRISCAA